MMRRPCVAAGWYAAILGDMRQRWPTFAPVWSTPMTQPCALGRRNRCSCSPKHRKSHERRLRAAVEQVILALNANELKSTAMDESTQHYREIRALLEQLVARWPWDRPGTAFESAKIYLDFHCADCGAKLSVNDLAVVLELEMLRLGTADTRSVPYCDPICVRCYIGHAASVCSVADHTGPAISVTSGGLLLDTHGAGITNRNVPVKRRSWRHLRSWYLIGAIILVVVISIVLLAFQPARHAVTAPTHATPGAMPPNRHGAAILAQPGGALLACCQG